MISYDPKEWFTFLFKIHKYETFRQLLPLMFGVALYSGLIAYIEIGSFISPELKEQTKSISTIFSILGFTLSLMLAFRTNSAYDRWWEGRKLWGDLTNSSRGFSAHINGILTIADYQNRKIIAAHIACFAYALRFHLKSEKMDRDILENELDESFLLDYRELFSSANNQPVTIFKSLVNYIHQLNREGLITPEQLYLLKPELNKFIDVCGACERIKSTPIPFSYAAFLKKFIFFYVMLFPLIYGMHMSYYIIPVTVFILYVLSSIELIAEEIEDPFSDSPNDLPTFKLAKGIAHGAKQIISTTL
jgi:putative membrane protein